MNILFNGCSKDDNKDEIDNGAANIATFINAKWKISNPNSIYASFEFNKDGNYIIVKNESVVKSATRLNSTTSKKNFLSQFSRINVRAASESNISPIHFGTYSIEGNTIKLSGFGIVNVISITAEKISFSVKTESTGEILNYDADKAQNLIATSNRTEMLCRSWVLNKISIDVTSINEEDKNFYIEEYGSNWKAMAEKELNDNRAGLTVLFSRAGTYLVTYTNEEPGLSEWKWANKEETAIYYSWDNWKDNWTDYPVFIKELSSTTLKIQEEFEIYELKLLK